PYLCTFLDGVRRIRRNQEPMWRCTFNDRTGPSTWFLGTVEQQDILVGPTLQYLLRLFQRQSHRVLTTSHDRVFHRCDQSPPVRGDLNLDPQGRNRLEGQPRFGYRPGIVLRQSPLWSCSSGPRFGPPNVANEQRDAAL